MMITRIRVMCGRTDVKTSKHEMIKYKGFQIVHFLCWHVKCKVPMLRSELHIRWISKRRILKSRDICRLLENNRCLLKNNRKARHLIPLPCFTHAKVSTHTVFLTNANILPTLFFWHTPLIWPTPKFYGPTQPMLKFDPHYPQTHPPTLHMLLTPPTLFSRLVIK